MSSRIKSIRTTASGNAPGQTPVKGQDSPSLWRQASDNWKHLQPQLKHLRWHQVPPAMLRDFMAAADDLFGEDRQQLASQQIAHALVASKREDWRLQVDWPEAGYAMRLDLSVGTHSEKSEPGLIVEAEIDPRTLDLNGARGGVRTLLDAVFKKSDDDPSRAPARIRGPLIDALPDAQLIQMVADIDALTGGDDLATLSTAAGVMRYWQQAETVCAEESDAVLTGLTNAGKYVLPADQSVFIKMRCRRPENIKDSAQDAGERLNVRIAVEDRSKPRKVR